MPQNASSTRPDLPPDRGSLLTEQVLPASAQLDALSTADRLRVINDQDASIAAVVRAAIPTIAALVDHAVEHMRRGGRLIYLGAGTSGRLGVLDASECPPTFQCDPSLVVGIIAGGDGALRRSSEGAEDDPRGAEAQLAQLAIDERDTVVGIAAGATTPYVLGALALAQQRGTHTALLCCVDEAAARVAISTSPLALPTMPLIIALPVGPEVVTGSTRLKAGTATKLALNMISTAVFVGLGKTWGNLMVDLRASNAKLRDRAARILASQCQLDRQDAFALLDRAAGQVKLALVMHHRGIDPDEAQRLLDKSRGTLRAIIGAPR